MRDDLRVAVVGGGIAGLVAAFDLARGGARVTLFEASDSLGGRLRRVELGGVPADIGAEAFAVRGGGVAQLLGELGLAGEVVSPAPLGSWILSRRGAFPTPPSGLLGIPARPLSRASRKALGLIGALRAACEPLLPRRVGDTSTSFAELVRVRLGRRVLDRLVAPVTLGVYSKNPDHLPVPASLREALDTHGSLVVGARRVREASSAAGAAVAGLRDGMGALVNALEREVQAAGAEIRTNAPVTGITAVENGWRVSSDAGAVDVDAVLLASVDAFEQLHTDASPLERVSVEVVALLVRDARLDRAPRGTGVLVAPSAMAKASGTRAKALTHASAKWPGRFRRLTPGTHLVRLSYGSGTTPPLTSELTDDEVRAQALKDASLILGIQLDPSSVEGIARAQWESAATRLADNVELPTGWHLAGDWVSGTGLATVVPGARAAAQALLATPPNTPHADLPETITHD